MKYISVILVLVMPKLSHGQGGLAIMGYDTIMAKEFRAQKVVKFQYDSLTIFLDYEAVKLFGQSLCHQGAHLSGTAKSIMSRLEREVATTDTGYLDQAFFLPLNWAPFHDFLCSEIQWGNCIVKDQYDTIHTNFVLAFAHRNNGRHLVWSGILFLLLGKTKWFIEKTLIET